MNIQLQKIDVSRVDSHVVILVGKDTISQAAFLTPEEKSFVEAHSDTEFHTISRLPYTLNVIVAKEDTPDAWHSIRCAAANIQKQLVKLEAKSLKIWAPEVSEKQAMALVEGLILSNYRFQTYKNKKETLLETLIVEAPVKEKALAVMQNVCVSMDECRDWVNEIPMVLNAETFAQQIARKAEELGVRCEVLEQTQIQSLKMGGLLGVNRGSEDEARFVVLEYTPEGMENEAPIALVGKGITYDTGGLNIKPEDYMQEMKSDMAGAATMASTLFAAARNQLKVHLMAFLPMTDNRPSGNAYAADDVLKMYDGTTVEIINTDAEGRLILADAIAYSNQYNPKLVITAATLTGAAVRAIGTYGIAAMQEKTPDNTYMEKLMGSGIQTHERIVEFPMWKEYEEHIKSEIADLKNCGPGQAGTVTAGKFLAHFAKNPFIHLDIAGVAYYPKWETFYGVGASGFGVRLLHDFLQTI